MAVRFVAKRESAVALMRRHSPSQGGQSIVEFALVLPLLLLLTFGVIEFGFFVYNQQIITNAAREGARAGIVATQPRVCDTIACDQVGNSSIEWVVQQYCATHLVTFGAQNTPVTTVAGYANNAPFGANLSVTVEYGYSFFFFPILANLDTSETIRAVAVMRYE